MINYLTHNVWNSLEKTFEIEVDAEEDDLVFETNGFVFLIQRGGNFNNVIAKKLRFVPGTLKNAIIDFQKVMEEQGIQYIRVDGNKRRYKFLEKMLPRLFDSKVGFIKDRDITFRNVYYIRCYP